MEMTGSPHNEPANDKTKKQRRRLSSDERRKEFIQKSIKLFAEEGFESSTRELARRLGVTQPLLYRYFPSKQALIAAVYEEVYLRRWRPEWEDLIADRSRPLSKRLIEFYDKYTDAIFHPDWIRIYLYSGLKGVEINTRYMDLVAGKILEPIITEARAEGGYPSKPASDEDLDAIWMVHGGIFYFGVVKLVYENKSPDGKKAAIEFVVTSMIDGSKRRFDAETNPPIQ